MSGVSDFLAVALAAQPAVRIVDRLEQALKQGASSTGQARSNVGPRRLKSGVA